MEKIGEKRSRHLLQQKTYVNRIQTISESKPELLVAHAYTRYLGDLSGGQILKKYCSKSYELKGESKA